MNVGEKVQLFALVLTAIGTFATILTIQERSHRRGLAVILVLVVSGAFLSLARSASLRNQSATPNQSVSKVIEAREDRGVKVPASDTPQKAATVTPLPASPPVVPSSGPNTARNDFVDVVARDWTKEYRVQVRVTDARIVDDDWVVVTVEVMNQSGETLSIVTKNRPTLSIEHEDYYLADARGIRCSGWAVDAVKDNVAQPRLPSSLPNSASINGLKPGARAKFRVSFGCRIIFTRAIEFKGPITFSHKHAGSWGMYIAEGTSVSLEDYSLPVVLAN
jgi:hypothetical protein